MLKEIDNLEWLGTKSPALEIQCSILPNNFGSRDIAVLRYASLEEGDWC